MVAIYETEIRDVTVVPLNVTATVFGSKLRSSICEVQFDPRRGLLGSLSPVRHLDSPGFSISPNAIFWPSLNVTRDYVFLGIRTATGNIWMA